MSTFYKCDMCGEEAPIYKPWRVILKGKKKWFFVREYSICQAGNKALTEYTPADLCRACVLKILREGELV